MATNLSDLLDAIRIRRTEWMVLETGSEEAIVVPAEGETLLYLVIAGEVILDIEDGPFALEVGGAAFVMNGRSHRLLGSADARRPRQVAFPGGERPDVPPLVRTGAGQRASARVVVGRLKIDPGPCNPILSMVPEVLPMTVESLRFVAFNSVMITEIISRPGAMAYLARAAELFFVRALQNRTYRSVAEDIQFSSALGSARILRALNAIRENPGAPWSVDRLASQACMSRSSFAAEFARIVGKPPMRLVTDLRLEAAANVLARGAVPVATVAWCVGYHSEATFSRVFKQRYGVSPGAYHREHANEASAVTARDAEAAPPLAAYA